MRKTTIAPRVGVVMGSRSDWETMRHAADMLASLGVVHEVEVVSAHRTPDKLFAYAEGASARGIEVIIAGAGGAAHLPGMLAAKTRLPVLGVPMQSRALKGLDSLLSIAQMPAGVPVGTLAIGEPGAKNAGLLAAAIVALHDDRIAQALDRFREAQTAQVLEHSDPRLAPPHPAPVRKPRPRRGDEGK
ncbi:MAG: 5-(carboxyamino)imidazole ribonucleotide mutase [Rhodanobacteraceae bacterium]